MNDGGRSGQAPVAVLGAGGVGGLIAALLARSGADVTCLVPRSTAEVLQRSGLHVTSHRFGDFTTRVTAEEGLSRKPDTVFVAVKATQLESALDLIPPTLVEGATVVPLLNGVDHVALLRRRLPAAHVIAAAIRVESTRVGPGQIRHTSPFAAVELGPRGQERPIAEAVTAQLSAAGLDTSVGPDESAVLWSKLSFVGPLALLTTHEQAPAGAVRRNRRRDLLALIQEVVAVARAEGAPLEVQTAVAFFDGVPEALQSSMQRDAAAGRPLELDAIGGAVVRAAERHGLQVPVTTRLVEDLASRYGAP